MNTNPAKLGHSFLVFRNDAKRRHGGLTNMFEIFKRDNFQCQRCGSKESLELHHIEADGKYGGSNPNHNSENQITLCSSCHTKETNQKRWGDRFNKKRRFCELCKKLLKPHQKEIPSLFNKRRFCNFVCRNRWLANKVKLSPKEKMSRQRKRAMTYFKNNREMCLKRMKIYRHSLIH